MCGGVSVGGGGGGRRLGVWNLFHGLAAPLVPGMRVLVSRVGRLTSRELGAWPPTSRLVSGCRAPWMGSGPGLGLGLVWRSWRLWGSVSSAGDRVGRTAQAQVRGQGHGEHAMGTRRCAEGGRARAPGPSAALGSGAGPPCGSAGGGSGSSAGCGRGWPCRWGRCPSSGRRAGSVAGEAVWLGG